jgi:hypothetical protein
VVVLSACVANVWLLAPRLPPTGLGVLSVGTVLSGGVLHLWLTRIATQSAVRVGARQRRQVARHLKRLQVAIADLDQTAHSSLQRSARAGHPPIEALDGSLSRHELEFLVERLRVGLLAVPIREA